MSPSVVVRLGLLDGGVSEIISNRRFMALFSYSASVGCGGTSIGVGLTLC